MNRTNLLLLLCGLLLAPALLINLGLMTFIDDEAIRSLVALEMELSGNYIVPTLNGEWYYNKPPLFNWLLIGYFRLFGAWEEWVPRFATVVSLLGYAATIVYFFRKHFPARLAWINALAFITCGRVLFWDSQLGLIDITYSWIAFMGFMVVYDAYEKQRWQSLFLISYALTAAGFLMKGLPSVVFQGLTLLAFFAYRRDWRRFFSLAHVAGGLLFLLLIGIYYWQYSQYHTLQEIFPTLLSESSKRTAVQYGWQDTVLHLFTFPFEMAYHFFPWSLGALFLFHRKVWEWLRSDDFVFYLFLIFSVNIVLYWTSVEVYPRYLLMHAPLLFGVFFFLMEKQGGWKQGFVQAVWAAVIVLALAASALPFFLERAQFVPGFWWKGALLTAAMASLGWLFWKWKDERALVFIAALLVVRVGFNWFVLPDRNAHDRGAEVRESCKLAGERYREEPGMYIYGETQLQTTNSFYLTAARQRILERKRDEPQPGDLLIIDPVRYPALPAGPAGEIKMRHNHSTLKIVRFLSEDHRLPK